jgi:hypothetical protein
MAQQHAAARNNPARVPLASAAGLFSLSRNQTINIVPWKDL